MNIAVLIRNLSQVSRSTILLKTPKIKKIILFCSPEN